MKQLLPLFLFLLPCLVLAQYPSNGNQKITLGEQTSADGLIYRGVLADTGIITPSSDTSAYIILDTVNHRFYNYNRATNVWSVTTIGSISSGLTGVLPVANGGTGSGTQNFVDLTTTQTVGGAKTFTSAVTATRFNPTANTVTGTGMYLPGSSVLGFSTSNLERMRIFDNGNVAINTTSFGFNLMVGGNPPNIAIQNTSFTRDTISYTASLSFEDKDKNRMAIFGITSSANNEFVFGNFGAGDFRFNTGTTIGSSSERMRITNTGNIGIGQLAPTAVLHLKAGTSTASTAPLKFTSQGASLLNPVEGGSVEFNGTNLLFTPSTTRHTVNHGLTGSATLNFPSTTTLLSADLTITVTGAADGDVVSLGVPNAAVNANTSYSAWVSAANTVTVRFNNYSIGTVDPASALFKVFVTK